MAMNAQQIRNILVVDDEPDLREMLAEALADADVRVMTAGSGAEAISLARTCRPDIVITDLCLGDCNGLDVLDGLRGCFKTDLPAVVITGHGDIQAFTEASRRRPIELMLKPLDINRLRETVRRELGRCQDATHLSRRASRLRKLAHEVNRQRKHIKGQLRRDDQVIKDACDTLTTRMVAQEAVIDFQRSLIAARCDDDVFRNLFRLFVQRSGGLFGVAMVCNENAELRIVGRFGTPGPDGLAFCQRLCEPIVNLLLAKPRVTLLDAFEQQQVFDESIRRYLPGLSILAVPLSPAAGEMIGAVLLYRKGEQPFLDDDIRLAEAIAPSTAMAIERIG